MKQTFTAALAALVFCITGLLTAGCQNPPKCPDCPPDKSDSTLKLRAALAPGGGGGQPNPCLAAPLCGAGQTCADAACRVNIETYHRVGELQINTWIALAADKRSNNVPAATIQALLKDGQGQFRDCCTWTIDVPFPTLKPVAVMKTGAMPSNYFNMALFREIIEKANPDSFVFYTALQHGISTVVFKTYKGSNVQGWYNLSSTTPPVYLH